MKALKLIIVFVVIVGVIVGIFLLVSGHGTSGPSLPGPTDNTLKELSNKIETSWGMRDDWDENLYDTLWNNCTQLQAIRGVKTNILIEKNTVLAIEKIKSRIFAEWRKSNCSGSVVSKYKKAIDFIEERDSDVKNEKDAILIRRVYKTYSNAYSFVNGTVKCSPEYKGVTNSWNSFAKYRKSIEDKRDDIKNNADYTNYLSNIDFLKKGLSSEIAGKLKVAKEEFYGKLAEEIIAYYTDRERNDDELRTLRDARNRYKDEYGNDEALKGFVSKFTDEVRVRQAELEEI